VTDYPADGRTFQTAFGGSDPRKHCKGRGDYEHDNKFAHFKFLRPIGADKTPPPEESCNPCEA
jgi:hypothetical protein